MPSNSAPLAPGDSSTGRRTAHQSFEARSIAGVLEQNGTVTAERHILVVAHTGRPDSLEAGIQVCRSLVDAGLIPVLSEDEFADFMAAAPDARSRSPCWAPTSCSAISSS